MPKVIDFIMYGIVLLKLVVAIWAQPLDVTVIVCNLKIIVLQLCNSINSFCSYCWKSIFTKLKDKVQTIKEWCGYVHTTINYNNMMVVFVQCTRILYNQFFFYKKYLQWVPNTILCNKTTKHIYLQFWITYGLKIILWLLFYIYLRRAITTNCWRENQ